MRPGYGEQLIAEGDVEVAEDEQRLVEEFRRQLEQGMWAAIPVETADRSARGRDGARVRGHPARRRPRHLLPARRGRGAVSTGGDRRPLRHRDRRPRAALGGHAAVHRPPPGAPPRPQGRACRRRGRRVRPRPRAPRRAARPRAAEVVRERGGVGDVPRPRADPGLGRRVARQGAARRPVRLPDLPAQADRGLPAADRPPAQRVLRRVPGRDAALRLLAAARTPTTCSPSGWRSRATSGA